MFNIPRGGEDLTPEELSVKQIMFNLFTPALNLYLEYHNPAEYARWQGNCCRQTAIIGTMILRKALPEYKWSAWDGWFADKLMGRIVEYNHAWIYGINMETGRALLVDLSRIHKERLFIPTRANAYPSDHPEYKDMQELRREELPVDDLINQPEYYTSLPGTKVLADVAYIMAASAKQ